MTVRRVLQQAAEEARRADACDDCRHLIDGDDSPTFWKCGAFGGVYAVVVRAQHHLRCPAFVHRPPAPIAAPRPAGWLRRVWKWLW